MLSLGWKSRPTNSTGWIYYNYSLRYFIIFCHINAANWFGKISWETQPTQSRNLIVFNYVTLPRWIVSSLYAVTPSSSPVRRTAAQQCSDPSSDLDARNVDHRPGLQLVTLWSRFTAGCRAGPRCVIFTHRAQSHRPCSAHLDPQESLLAFS